MKNYNPMGQCKGEIKKEKNKKKELCVILSVRLLPQIPEYMANKHVSKSLQRMSLR